MAALTRIRLCLRCGYVPEANYGEDEADTPNDNAHWQRCDYIVAVRYRNNKTGRITGGPRSVLGVRDA